MFSNWKREITDLRIFFGAFCVLLAMANFVCAWGPPAPVWVFWTSIAIGFTILGVAAWHFLRAVVGEPPDDERKGAAPLGKGLSGQERSGKMSAKAKAKVKRVKCSDCGQEFDEGPPHSAFCTGCPPDSECEECGEKGSEDRGVFKCRECDSIVCSECGYEGERLCTECMEH